MITGGVTIYNYVMLIGNLVEDVDVRKAPNGSNVSTITLAVNRPYRNPKTDQIDTDFIDISIWDELCDIAATYLKKGSKVAVKGRLKVDKVTLDTGAIINKISIVTIFYKSTKTK